MKTVETDAGMHGKVMVIDDSAVMRVLVSIALENVGYEVITATDSREALTKIDSQHVSMVITDLYMNGVDGISFIQEVRSRDRYKYIPIVVLTTEFREAKKQEGRAAGATAWIVKPFGWEELMGVVNRFLT